MHELDLQYKKKRWYSIEQNGGVDSELVYVKIWIQPDTRRYYKIAGYIWIFEELDEFISSNIGNNSISISRCLDLRDFQRKGKLSHLFIYISPHAV